MARHIIGDPPFPPVLVFDENRDFTVKDLRRITHTRALGASLCIRYSGGPAQRGGYFFHFAPSTTNAKEFDLYDFERRRVKSFTADSLVAFINHCTGRVFDEPSFNLCQTELNFLKDEEPNA